jgi:hypothetical protein
MAAKIRKELIEEISDLCEQHGCNRKTKKVHLSQYADRQWNPHPPQHFINWWGSVGIEKTEKRTKNAWRDIDAIRAFNCEAVRETYREAKQIGAA